MATYLVIEFDDDAQADALCAQINTATAKGKAFRVVGRFMKPRRNCRCANSRAEYVELITKGAKPVRGAKYGWFVCPNCRRPRFGDQVVDNLIGVEDVLDPSTFSEISWLSALPKMATWRYVVKGLHISVLPVKDS